MYKNLESEADERSKRVPDYRAQTSEQSGQPRAQTAGNELEDDPAAVGDLESSGFGVGIAPGSARPVGTSVVSSKKGDKNAKTKGGKFVTKPSSTVLNESTRDFTQESIREIVRVSFFFIPL
jgi:hypothetical protein